VIKYNNPQELIADFVTWRIDRYKDRYDLLLQKEEEQALFWRCFLTCFGGSQSVASSISGIKSKADLSKLVSNAIETAKLELRSDIVNRIVGLPVYKFTEEGQDEAKNKLTSTEKRITEYASILKNPRKRKNIYKKEVSDGK